MVRLSAAQQVGEPLRGMVNGLVLHNEEERKRAWAAYCQAQAEARASNVSPGHFAYAPRIYVCHPRAGRPRGQLTAIMPQDQSPDRRTRERRDHPLTEVSTPTMIRAVRCIE